MEFIKLILITLVLISPIYASGDKAAKAIIVRGSVKALIDGKVIEVKRGEWLPQGANVQTATKSFAKLLFKDKSTMNVGPDSQMKIDSFPEKEAGIITLVKGTIRSKVTKNYMQIKDKDKSKLFIKTKTAAMGVRGTDFQVAYNPINENTSLITFEGAVAMAKLADLAGSRINQRALERVVSSPDAVMVRRGQFSGATPNAKKATIPVKISPVQLETLDKNESLGTDPPAGDSQTSNEPKKKFRSVVPPGMDSKLVANDSSSVDSVMSETMGGDTVKAVEKSVAIEAPALEQAPPEGSIDTATGKIAPTAGGFIDLKTAQYIPPPPGSTYDSNAGVYVPPPEMGGVDLATGNYTNDRFVLNEDGTFTERTDIPQPESSTDGRNPASTTSGEAPPPPVASLVPTMAENLDQEAMASAFEGDAPPPPVFNAPSSDGDPTLAGMDPNLGSLVEEQMNENSETFDDFNNSDNNLIFGDINQRSTVNFDVTVE